MWLRGFANVHRKQGDAARPCQQPPNRDVRRILQTSEKEIISVFRLFLSSEPLWEWAKKHFRRVKPGVYPENANSIEITETRKHPRGRLLECFGQDKPEKIPTLYIHVPPPHHLHRLFHPLFGLLRQHRARAARNLRGPYLRLHTAPRQPRSVPEAAAEEERWQRNAVGAGCRFRGNRTVRHSGANSRRTTAPQASERRRRRRAGSNRKRSCSATVSAPFPLRWQSLRKVAFVVFGEHRVGRRRSSRVVRAKRRRNVFLVNHSSFPLGSPHPQGLKMLRSTWNFLKRHKKKCIFLGTVLGGGWQRSWKGA